MMINSCLKQGYFLDKLLKAIKEKFIREGNFQKERLNFRNKKRK